MTGKPSEEFCAPYKFQAQKAGHAVAKAINLFLLAKGIAVKAVTLPDYVGCSAVQIEVCTDEEEASLRQDTVLLETIDQMITQSDLPAKAKQWHHAAYGYDPTLEKELAYLLTMPTTVVSAAGLQREYAQTYPR